MIFIKNHKWLVAIGGVILLGIIANAVSEPSPSAASQTSTYQTPTYQTQPTQSPVYQAQPIQSSQSVPSTNSNYYINVDGNKVQSPTYSNTVPAGASARCGDGTYSFSQHRSGTCSHHGGVSSWL